MVDVVREFTALYVINTSVQQEFTGVTTDFLSTLVWREFTALYYDRVQAEFTGAYSIATAVSREFTGASGLPVMDAVVKEYTALASLRVEKEYTAVYSIQVPVASEFTGRSYVSDLDPVLYEFTSPVGLLVELEFTGIYSTLLPVSTEFVGDATLTTGVAKEFTSNSRILAHNPVSSEFTGLYVVRGASIVTDAPAFYLSFTFGQVDVLDFSVSITEDEFFYTVEAAIGRYADYQKIKYNDAFTITLGTEVYHFVVQSKMLDRSSPASEEMRITGYSPSVQHAFPRQSTPYSKVWETPEMASAIVSDTGLSLSWGIVDWAIPAWRVSFEGVDSITVLQSIARVAGGVVECDIDGSLLVRHMYPVATPQYTTAIPAFILTELRHIIEAHSSETYDAIYNKVRLLDEEAVYGDTFEWEQTEDGKYTGRLKLYKSPWREDVIVQNTDSVSFTRVGTTTELIDGDDGEGELITITSGKAQTNKPVHGVSSIRWLSDPLGGVSFVPETSELTFISSNSFYGYGLMLIKYTTKYDLYSVRSTTGDPTQFISVEETE